MCTKSLGAAAVLVTTFTLGCGGGSAELSGRIAQLRSEQAQRQADLERIQQEIRTAQIEQQRQQCRAYAARLQAEVALASANCLEARSQYAACVANNEAHKSKGGLLGCLVGLGAAVATGGAAAPMAVAGCAGGLLVGGATTNSCGQNPVCTIDETLLQSAALAQDGLTAWPQCP